MEDGFRFLQEVVFDLIKDSLWLCPQITAKVSVSVLPLELGSKGSTNFFALLLTIVSEPHLETLNVRLAHWAKACTLSRTGASFALEAEVISIH